MVKYGQDSMLTVGLVVGGAVKIIKYIRAMLGFSWVSCEVMVCITPQYQCYSGASECWKKQKICCWSFVDDIGS